MLYRVKHLPEDFQVDEILDTEFSDQGEFVYIRFRKRDTNTMDVIKHLITTLKIDRHVLGVSGLKDKKAVTTQWISMHTLDLEEAG